MATSAMAYLLAILEVQCLHPVFGSSLVGMVHLLAIPQGKIQRYLA
jgi:hypothetical protein